MIESLKSTGGGGEEFPAELKSIITQVDTCHLVSLASAAKAIQSGSPINPKLVNKVAVAAVISAYHASSLETKVAISARVPEQLRPLVPIADQIPPAAFASLALMAVDIKAHAGNLNQVSTFDKEAVTAVFQAYIDAPASVKQSLADLAPPGSRPFLPLLERIPPATVGSLAMTALKAAASGDMQPEYLDPAAVGGLLAAYQGAPKELKSELAELAPPQIRSCRVLEARLWSFPSWRREVHLLIFILIRDNTFFRA
jgi:hypothetical protein